MWSPNEPLPGRRSTSQFATSARGLADGRSTSTQKPVTWTLEHFAPGGGHLLIQGWEGDDANGPFLAKVEASLANISCLAMTRCTTDFGEAMVPDAGAIPNFVTASPELPQGLMQSVGILVM